MCKPVTPDVTKRVARNDDDDDDDSDKDKDKDKDNDRRSLVDDLVAKARSAIKDTQYGKGMQLCKQALDIAPRDQHAAISCVIAACNLKQAASAARYLRIIKSSTRKAGLSQICVRLGVDTAKSKPEKKSKKPSGKTRSSADRRH